VPAGLRSTVVGLVVAKLFVGAIGATLVRGIGAGTLWAVLLGVEFAFLGAAAVAFAARHVFTARVGSIAGYRTFLRARWLTVYTGNLGVCLLSFIALFWLVVIGWKGIGVICLLLRLILLWG
jgi:hypothetical protein